MNYNPYDLVEMKINDKPIHGRPIEFDSEIADFSKLTNAFGVFVRPKKLSTVCPDCGQGLIVDVALPDPPFPVIEHNCPYCRPGQSITPDPFCNPLESEILSQHELDPLLYNLNKPLRREETSVAERLPTKLVEEIEKASAEVPLVGSPMIFEQDTDAELIEILEGEKSEKEKPEKPKRKKQPKIKTTAKAEESEAETPEPETPDLDIQDLEELDDLIDP